MSGYALVIDGARLGATVVGGGAVATRKARALLDAGASVAVVAPAIADELRALVPHERLRLIEERYEPRHLEGARLVIAATDDARVNAAVAADARARGLFVNVADAPEGGDCLTPATHRVGDLLVAVTAGGVPAAAARIRDEIACRFDERYAEALGVLAALRRRQLSAGDREAWREASRTLIDDGFCARVESGELVKAVARWA